MTVEAWAAFAAAALALMSMPGSTNLVLVSYGLSLGRAALWPAVLGVALGRVAAVGLAAGGAGVLLATSPLALAGVQAADVQAAGVGYLGWLRVRLWRAGDRPPGRAAGTAGTAAGRVLRHVSLVTLASPFSLAYVALPVPHAPARAERPWAEAAVMAATFLGLSVAVSLLCALLAAEAHRLWASRRVVLGCNRVGGAILLGAAVMGAASLAAGA